jgi:hypothetical protein
MSIMPGVEAPPGKGAGARIPGVFKRRERSAAAWISGQDDQRARQ